MPALGFKSQFVPMIEDGRKPHSIRAPRKLAFKPNVPLYLYYGMRTKQCRKIGTATCLGVSRIEIHPELETVTVRPFWGDGQAPYVAGQLIASDVVRLIHADGFDDAASFWAFFRDAAHHGTFEGHLIFWGDTFRKAEG